MMQFETILITGNFVLCWRRAFLIVLSRSTNQRLGHPRGTHPTALN